MMLANKNQWVKALLCLLTGLMVQAAFSGQLAPAGKSVHFEKEPVQQTSFYSRFSPKNAQIPIQFGVFASRQGKSQDINMVDLIGDHFAVHKDNNINGLVGLGYYVNGYDSKYYELAVGVNAYYLAQQSVRGTVTQEQLFTNLAYGYAVTNYPIYLAAKAALKNASDNYNVTLDLGLGPNIVHTSNFGETSIDGGVTLPDMAFSGRTRTAFSATAGMGLRLNNVFRNMPLECGYRFFYLGAGGFNTINSQILSDFKAGNAYANALICSVTV
ncbi:MAG: hypothetical protein ACHP65_06100 [Legionellales bacterium]